MSVRIIILTVCICVLTSLQTQQQQVKFGGKVYVQFRTASVVKGKEPTQLAKKYVSDFKIILVQKYYASEISVIENNKSKLCSNDKYLQGKYRAKVAYTNSDGYFEFVGLQKLTNYVLIFCDRNIQMSEVATGNRYTTYSIRDKLVKL